MDTERIPLCLPEGLREDLRAIADQKGAVSVTVHADGPYLVRGSFTIVDERGRVLTRSSSTVALCRCGRSRPKPFCDGSHKALRNWRGSAAASSGELLAGGDPQGGAPRRP